MQVFFAGSVFPCVGAYAGNVVHIDRVRCLECGTKYAKPADGGTMNENPGCPRCGYVGWIAASIPSLLAGVRRIATS